MTHERRPGPAAVAARGPGRPQRWPFSARMRAALSRQDVRGKVVQDDAARRAVSPGGADGLWRRSYGRCGGRYRHRPRHCRGNGAERWSQRCDRNRIRTLGRRCLLMDERKFLPYVYLGLGIVLAVGGALALKDMPVILTVLIGISVVLCFWQAYRVR